MSIAPVRTTGLLSLILGTTFLLSIVSTGRAQAPDVWVDFNPPADTFEATSGLDLRSLNEAVAGQDGRVRVEGDQFVLGSGKPVRFWGVNGPSRDATKTTEDARRVARWMAKRGVNLVRLHGTVFDPKTGEIDPKAVEKLSVIIDGSREAGIYSHLSFYFPLWLKPQPGNTELTGYDGNQHPFAALYFNPEFQKRYYGWMKSILTYTSPRTGKTIAEEPAVFGMELINEDSFFFWTFNDKAVPDPQLKIIEKKFGDWLTEKYGSPERARAAWNGLTLSRDNLAEGRIAMRPLWNVANERTRRDKDQARFLAGIQRTFYASAEKYAREQGFKGLVNASNWTTADARYLTPIEKWTYTGNDFLDRHGYFEPGLKGEFSSWSIRNGYTYRDVSALRFDAHEAGKSPVFNNPVNDPKWGGKPSMISETTFSRPNRYRTEAPLWYAAYGALQETNAIVHFAVDGANWDVKPNFFMQPWTLMSPTQFGQFPAAAMLYRQGLIDPGAVVADLHISVDDLLDLKGVDLSQKASLDALRATDVTPDAKQPDDAEVDALIHYVGRTSVGFTDGPARETKTTDLSPFIDRKNKTVTSTHRQVKLDWGMGLLTVDSPKAQAACGNLRAGEVMLSGMSVRSELDLGQVIVVPLDDHPLATSSKILVQVMSEERASGFKTEPAAGGRKRIVDIGRNPWQIRAITGTVVLKRPDAAALVVTALDANGQPIGAAGHADRIELLRDVMYYLVTK